MAIDISKLINEVEEITINNKVYKVKELTIREKMTCIKIITDMATELKNTNSVEELQAKIILLENKDLSFINEVFMLSGSAEPLPKEDFLNLTKTQTSKIMEVIEEKNSFFGKGLEKKTV